MAKPNRNRREPTFQGLTREQLIRDLGLDGLTRESCFEELFGEFLDDPPARAKPGRVTQTGPGRREPKKEE